MTAARLGWVAWSTASPARTTTHAKADECRRGGGCRHEVRSDRATRDEDVGILLDGFGNKELELTGLVARHRETGEVVALDHQGSAETEGVGQARCVEQRGGQHREPRAGRRRHGHVGSSCARAARPRRTTMSTIGAGRTRVRRQQLGLLDCQQAGVAQRAVHRDAGRSPLRQGGLECGPRGVVAEPGSEYRESTFAAGVAVEIRQHRRAVDLKARQQVDGELQRCCREQAHLGQCHPLGLPAAPVSLVLTHHPFQQHGGVGPHEAGEGVEMLTELGIALVRHRDAAHRAGPDRFAQLADLRSLQLVDLAADAGKGSRDHCQHATHLRDAIARRQPGDARVAQAQLGAETTANRQPGRALARQRAHPATQLPDQPARRALAEPVQVPAHLVGPAGRLPAERHRRTRLPVGAPGEHGVAVPLRQIEQQLLDAAQVAPDLATDGAQGQ